MRYSNDRYHLRVEIHTNGCDVPADERARMQTLLLPLDEAVKDLPTSDLTVKVIYHPHSELYHVALALKLPGQTLFMGSRDRYLDSAFQRGVRELARRVEMCKEHADRRVTEVAEHRLALDREVVAPEDPDAGPLGEAVRRGDYRTFRTALSRYEEWLRKRVGRWVQRYPEVERQIGAGLFLGDLVEEVYLNAFERFPQRPTAVRLSEWLERLIDRCLKELLRHPEAERENASLARTVRDGPLA